MNNLNLFKLVDLYSAEFIKKHKNTLLFYFIITLIYYVVEVVGISYIINKLKTADNNNQKLIIISAIVLISLVGINYVKGLSENKIVSNINSISRQKFLKGIIDRYKESYKDIQIGNVISRILNVTLEYRFGFILFMKVIFPSIIVLLICIIIIFQLHKNVAFLLFACLFFMVILSYYGYRKIAFKKINQEEIFYKNYDSMVNKYNNLFNSYINNEMVNDKEVLSTQQTNYSNTLLDADNAGNNNTTVLRANLCLFLFLIILYISNTKIDTVSLGILSIILIYFITTYLTFSIEISAFCSHLGISYGSYTFLNDLLQKKYRGHITNIQTGSVRIEKLFFHYKENHNILDNFNLDVRDKEKVALLGRSGSGKSTLATLILKLHPYAGKIYVDNTDIQMIDTDTLRNKILYINQRTVLLDKSVIDNMKYGNIDASDKMIYDLLNKYSLPVVFSGLKNGVNEQCLTGGSNISLGMQKVIILIRGILKVPNSKIVFFDEPLAGLDQVTRRKVIRMIRTECKDKTVIVITHDQEIIPYMDKVYHMNDINSNTITSNAILYHS